jgi:hypothetical protein
MDGNEYSSWGLSESIGITHGVGYIFNQNGTFATNPCVVDSYVDGLSVGAGGGLPIGIGGEAEIGEPGIGNGDEGVVVTHGPSLGLGGFVSYATGPTPC